MSSEVRSAGYVYCNHEWKNYKLWSFLPPHFGLYSASLDNIQYKDDTRGIEYSEQIRTTGVQEDSLKTHNNNQQRETKPSAPTQLQ